MTTSGNTIPDTSDHRRVEEEKKPRKKRAAQYQCAAGWGRTGLVRVQTFHAQTLILCMRRAVVLPSSSSRWRAAGSADA